MARDPNPVGGDSVSIIGSFAIIAGLGFSINILTLLAFVLGIGLVVDDAIVMLENIYRRIEEGEPVVHASIFGARQVAFAIIATTLTLAAVFVPVAFQSGQTGGSSMSLASPWPFPCWSQLSSR